jgi:hypothetical protein
MCPFQHPDFCGLHTRIHLDADKLIEQLEADKRKLEIMSERAKRLAYIRPNVSMGPWAEVEARSRQKRVEQSWIVAAECEELADKIEQDEWELHELLEG